MPLVFDGKFHEGVFAFQVQFSGNVGAVVVNRIHTDEQQPGNFCGAFSAGDQFDDDFFGWTQHFFGFHDRAVFMLRTVFCQEMFDFRTNVKFAFPDGIDADAVSASLKALPGVRDIHDLHIWAITSGVPSLSAHVVLDANGEGDEVHQRAVKHLDEKYEIEHVTLQMEKQDCRDGRDDHGLH